MITLRSEDGKSPARARPGCHPPLPARPDVAQRLQVVVLPATATTHPAAALFVLAGWNGDDLGFGGAVLDDMTWAAQAFRQLNQTMDLVFVEQRGTPGSELQTCPGLEDWLSSPAAIQAAARRCLASVSRDPRHDTTTSAVRDLGQVRQALGYHQVNLYGVSYGVTVAPAAGSGRRDGALTLVMREATRRTGLGRGRNAWGSMAVGLPGRRRAAGQYRFPAERAFRRHLRGFGRRCQARGRPATAGAR